MTDTRKDGGPAFPGQSLDDQGFPSRPHAPGMSLRDWFAGQALVGFLATPIGDGNPTAEDWARDSYAVADALIAERSK
jgi:hypothetical protein